MGWIQKIHSCFTPDAWEAYRDRSYGVGSLWACDECGQLWELQNNEGMFEMVRIEPLITLSIKEEVGLEAESHRYETPIAMDEDQDSPLPLCTCGHNYSDHTNEGLHCVKVTWIMPFGNRYVCPCAFYKPATQDSPCDHAHFFIEKGNPNKYWAYLYCPKCRERLR